MSDVAEAYFIGGPADGKLEVVQSTEDEIQILIPRPFSFEDESEINPARMFATALYRKVYDEFQQPTRTWNGALVYRFVGTE